MIATLGLSLPNQWRALLDIRPVPVNIFCI